MCFCSDIFIYLPFCLLTLLIFLNCKICVVCCSYLISDILPCATCLQFGVGGHRGANIKKTILEIHPGVLEKAWEKQRPLIDLILEAWWLGWEIAFTRVWWVPKSYSDCIYGEERNVFLQATGVHTHKQTHPVVKKIQGDKLGMMRSSIWIYLSCFSLWVPSSWLPWPDLQSMHPFNTVRLQKMTAHVMSKSMRSKEGGNASWSQRKHTNVLGAHKKQTPTKSFIFFL